MITFSGYTHRSCFMILPALFHTEHRCENEACGELHGWSLELGWAWWSIILERNYTADGTP